MTAREPRGRDDGFTLVELLVAMSVIMVVIAGSMSLVVLSSEAVTTARSSQDLNEEARHAINRMARDLRQATAVVTAVNPDGAGFDSSKLVAVRFTADFDGDDCIGGVGVGSCLDYNASNPEDVTYCFQPGTRQLYVTDNQSGATPVTASSTTCSGGQPLLAGTVSMFRISYRSSEYLYDLDPTDGVTTWRELDQTGVPVGNGNGTLDAELAHVNSLVLEVTTSVDGHSQVYRTQVDLRNLSH